MKCLLVDDHALFRDGLKLLVGMEFPDIEMLQAGTLSDALQLLSRHPQISLVLLDLKLPDASDLLALNAVRKHHDGVTCVVLSADENPSTVIAAIDAGAAGFIPKTTQARGMLHALRTVLAGGVYLPANVASQSLEKSPNSGSGLREPDLGLSSRQMEVLRMLVEGKSNKQISNSLMLSESTVKTHIEAIYRRLDVKSRTQAVVSAARLGLMMPVRDST